jgi:hypothetical protein
LRCSCGASLPEDARFCHKCGQPQYEEDIARLNAVEEPPPPPTASLPTPATSLRPLARISFANGRAVRITLSVAAFSLLAVFFVALIAPALIIPLFLAAGFSAVRIYINRTNESLNPSGAAFLGAMPWIWFFLLQAIGIIFLFFSPEGHEVVKAMKNPDYIQILNDPAKQVFPLLMGFVIGTASGALGGIIAVRWQPRSGPSH